MKLLNPSYLFIKKITDSLPVCKINGRGGSDMLSDSEYNLSISDEVVVRIKQKSSDVASQFIKMNVPKECVIVEKMASRTISIPNKFMGLKIGSKEVAEQYNQTVLSGWFLFENVVLMGEDSKDQEWYKWTRYYYLGEDGNIYSRYEEILEKYRSYSRSVDLRDAVKVESIKDFIQSDETQQTKDSGNSYYSFGGTIDNALNRLNSKHSK